MITFLPFLLRQLTEEAHAVWLEGVGRGAPGVDDMWASVRGTLPFGGVGANAPMAVISAVAQFIFALLAGIAICVIMYAGIIMMTSGFNESAVADAKKTIMYALIGLLLAVLAEAIITYLRVSVISQAVGGA